MLRTITCPACNAERSTKAGVGTRISCGCGHVWRAPAPTADDLAADGATPVGTTPVGTTPVVPEPATPVAKASPRARADASTVKVVRADGVTVKRQPPPAPKDPSPGEPVEGAPTADDAAPRRRATKKAPPAKRAAPRKKAAKVPPPVAPASTPRRGGAGYYSRVRRAG